MLLLDIGNTNVKSYDGNFVRRDSVKDFIFPKEKFYFINVNPSFETHLAKMVQAIDLTSFFSFKTAYKGMGIDRLAACYSITDGVVVDAGSAVTVDVMRKGIHKGGFIMPGLSAYKDSFANISSKLIYDLEKEITLEKLPLNTNDALLYATLKSIVLMIENSAKDLPIFMTGGDGSVLCKYLKHCSYDEMLVFKGMQKVIKEMGEHVNDSLT